MNEIAARTSSNATPSKSTVKQRQTIETEAKTLQKACMTKKPNANFFHGIAQAANNNNMLLPISQAGKDKSKMKLRKKAQMQRTIEKPCKKNTNSKIIETREKTRNDSHETTNASHCIQELHNDSLNSSSSSKHYRQAPRKCKKKLHENRKKHRNRKASCKTDKPTTD